jgi:hypothetical protein
MMSKYDDVQQFKNKINMKDIDYKEFPKDDGSSALHRWAIVEQVAEGGNGISSGIERSMQPTSVSATEFSPAPSLSLNQPTQPNVAPAQNQALPRHVSHDFKQTIPPVSEPNRSEQFAAPVVSSAPPSSQPLDTKRFKKMFSKKTPSAGNTGRDTLLKPLLEMIASCR